MPVLYFCVRCMGNGPQCTLKQLGKLQLVQPHELPCEPGELTWQEASRIYRLELESDDRELGLLVRGLVTRNMVRLLQTDSNWINWALRPDPAEIGLVWAVQRFKEDNRHSWQTFWDAMGPCWIVSREFHSFLLQKRVITRAQSDLGELVANGERVVQYGAVGVYSGPYPRASFGYHAYNFFGRIGIDWTHRQLDANCKFPHIFRLPEGHRFPRPGIDYDQSDYQIHRSDDV